MRKAFCDACGVDLEKQAPNTMNVPIHIIEGVKGHVNGFVDRSGNPVSGRTVNFDLCNSCFNSSFYEAIKVVKSIQAKSAFNPNLETDLT